MGQLFSIFTTNKKTDVLMSTTQLDHCCKVIETSMEFPSDEYLIKLVKIQQLAQTISITVSSDGMAPMSLPLVMVVQSFQDQLDTFRASLPPRLAQNRTFSVPLFFLPLTVQLTSESLATLLCHISVAEILLKDMAISDQRCSPDNMQVSDRLQLLWSCVKSLNDFFEVRFAEPEIEKPRFLCIIASDLAYTLITGIKLLTLQLPGWDAASITKELDMVVIFGKQIDHLMEIIAKRRSGLLSPDRCGIEDPLERLVRLMRTAQELVSMHINGGSPLQMVDDMGAVAWRDIMNEVPWGMEDSQGLIDLAS